MSSYACQKQSYVPIKAPKTGQISPETRQQDVLQSSPKNKQDVAINPPNKQAKYLNKPVQKEKHNVPIIPPLPPPNTHTHTLRQLEVK